MKTCSPSNQKVEMSSLAYEKDGMPKTFSLDHLMKMFTEPEQLDADNMWYCSNCKEHVQASIKLQLYKAPEYLIIHMKKLKNSEYGFSRSTSFEANACKSITFPINDFDITPYVLNKESVQDYNIQPSEFCDEGNYRLTNRMVEESPFDSSKPLLYDLYGVVNHYGTMNFGHYTAFCKDDAEGVWHTYDDQSVSSMKESQVITDAAYVLFYKRKKL